MPPPSALNGYIALRPNAGGIALPSLRASFDECWNCIRDACGLIFVDQSRSAGWRVRAARLILLAEGETPPPVKDDDSIVLFGWIIPAPNGAIVPALLRDGRTECWDALCAAKLFGAASQAEAEGWRISSARITVRAG